MDDELIDILNEDLTIQKTCLKSYAHMHGLLHASVHIWFYTSSGEVLLQRRAKTKIAFPSLWDISVAGHITSGENKYEAAIREVKEEIGIDISKKELINIGAFKEKIKHTSSFLDNEIHHLFLCQLNFEIEQLNIQVEELSELKLISIEEFQNDLKSLSSKKEYVPNQQNYYKIIISEISKYL
ncbi:MAG: isopentenyl-diphosphate delta-isomerase [Urechidicola sp.]|jgi:isopentenyl-diphosphate delta-isomerase|tara:strand:- start:2571 stop:3119 length:549 start_codon:yes stop_codon:yes gene_type:complete